MFIAVPVRTASELPYRLQDFELRMFYAADIAQPSAEVGNQVSLLRLSVIFRENGPTVNFCNFFGNRG